MLSSKQQKGNRISRYQNALSKRKESTGEKIVLLSEHKMKKFDVFLDQEIGIPKHYQNKIQEIVQEFIYLGC